MDEQNLRALQRKRFLISLAYVLAIVALAALICRYALGTLLPFLIAWAVAALLRPLLRLIQSHQRRPRRALGVALTVAFYLVVAFLGTILFSRLFDTAVAVLTAIPELWTETVMPALQTAGEKLEELFAHFDVTLNLSVAEIVSSIGRTVTSYSARLLGKIGNLAISIPGMLVNMIICVISTVYILLDWNAIRNFLYRQLSARASDVLAKASGQTAKTLWQYARSYGLIMLITFAEISIGLLLIGIDGAVLIGALIALVDIFPVVGSGTVLLPWTILSLIGGDVRTGVCLLLLYAVVTVIRNIIEPKIVGKQVGLHPLVTLLAMVVGVSVFGGAGMLGLPVAVAVVKQLNDDGAIHLFK